METLLERFENKAPEIIFEWSDSETEAKGWVVINSLRGGAAGGGTRMRKGLDCNEVVSLAKTMEIKFTVSGPAIGGAKSGICFDPNDPRKEGVLKRWFKAVRPLLKYYYGTGGDLNVDEVHEVIPYTSELGILHPQEGVVNGHYGENNTAHSQQIRNLITGVSRVVEDEKYSPSVMRKYLVADLITGYGVAESVKHFYDIYGGKLAGKRVIIQGWGNVASAAAYYLSLMDAVIVGIADREGGLLNENGFSRLDVHNLFLNKKGNQLYQQNLIPADEMMKRVWSIGADIFIPGAASRLVTREQAETMINNGLELVSSGANVPFADKEIFAGPIATYVDEKVSVIPDFIANCGMARAFAYLMSPHCKNNDEAIFSDVSDTIRNAMVKAHGFNPSKNNISKTSLEIAIQQLI
jgi:glutamate dehydrogenase/leucine dehydrogenase